MAYYVSVSEAAVSKAETDSERFYINSLCSHRTHAIWLRYAKKIFTSAADILSLFPMKYLTV